MAKRKRQLSDNTKQTRSSAEVLSERQGDPSAGVGRPLSWWWFCAIAVLVGVLHRNVTNHPKV